MTKKQIITLVVAIIAVACLATIYVINTKEPEVQYEELEGRFAELKTGSTMFITQKHAILLKSNSFDDQGVQLTSGDIIVVKFANISETFPEEAEDIIFVKKVADGELADVLELEPAKRLIEENGEDYFNPGIFAPSPN